MYNNNTLRNIVIKLIFAVLFSFDLSNGHLTLDISELENRVTLIVISLFKGNKPPKNKINKKP